MKTATVVAWLFALASAVCAQDIQMTDYSVPVSSAQSLLLNGDYSYTTLGDSTTSNMGHGKVIFKHFYSSLPLAWSIDADGTFSNDDGDISAASAVTGRYQQYFKNQRNAFFFAGGAASYMDGFDTPISRLSAGVGYGRFINATAFARAIRIDQFLVAEGVLSDHMSREALVKIGHVIEREGEFRDRHGDTYEVEWYKAVEEVIRASGKLAAEGVGAAGILRIKEVLTFERVQDRFYGGDIRLGMGMDVTTANEGDERNPTAEIGFSLSYPLDLNSQFNHRTLFNTDTDNVGKTYDLTSSSDYTYEVSNRIDVLTGYQFQRNVVAEVGANSHLLRTSFIFFVENQLNLVLNTQLEKMGAADWSSAAVMTLGYRVL